MGRYVNHTSKGSLGSSMREKCNGLLEDGAAEVHPTKFVENLVCVVDNGPFAAAGFCYSESEFKAFNQQDDLRHRRWFVWEKVKEFAS